MYTENNDVTTLSVWELRLLTLLSSKGEAFGLQIVGAFEGIYKRRIGTSLIYPNLKKLAEKGFVTLRREESGERGAGGRRNYYEITETGKKVLFEEESRYQALQAWKPGKAQSL
jgi:PadR family transcriptional regulator, regulatory protein PadR